MKLDFQLLLSILSNVNTFSRIILVITLSLTTFWVSVFANGTGKDIESTRTQSGSITNTENSKEEVSEEDEGKDTKQEVSEEKKEKIKQEISSYIIESYKAQWDKILKDIDQTLQKTVSDKSDRIEAYKKIRTSLEARKDRNSASKKISESSKKIVNEFLSHMIEWIDKKITELSK